MSEASIVIEIANPRDVRAISVLARDEIEVGLTWRYRQGRLLKLMQERETIVLVARDSVVNRSESRIVGFGVMRYSHFDAHLLLLAVDPSCRRRGIGSDLIGWLHKTALYAGIQTVHLEVRHSNFEAIKFYETVGYNKQQLLENYYEVGSGHAEHAWHMTYSMVGQKERE